MSSQAAADFSSLPSEIVLLVTKPSFVSQHFLAEAQQEAERRFKAYQDMAQGHADPSKPGA